MKVEIEAKDWLPNKILEARIVFCAVRWWAHCWQALRSTINKMADKSVHAAFVAGVAGTVEVVSAGGETNLRWGAVADCLCCAELSVLNEVLSASVPLQLQPWLPPTALNLTNNALLGLIDRCALHSVCLLPTRTDVRARVQRRDCDWA